MLTYQNMSLEKGDAKVKSNFTSNLSKINNKKNSPRTSQIILQT